MSNNSDISTTGGNEYRQGNNHTITPIIQNVSINQTLNNLEQLEETELNLSNRGLTDLNIQIFNFTLLEDLDLSNNQLTSLPTEIGNLGELVNLYLSNNQLTSLPTEIGNLGELKYLDLSNNQLTSLPPVIWNLDLEQLNLSNNQLTSLPEIPENRSLLSFDLGTNPYLQRLPDSIVNLSVIDFTDPGRLVHNSPQPIIDDSDRNNSSIGTDHPPGA